MTLKFVDKIYNSPSSGGLERRWVMPQVGLLAITAKHQDAGHVRQAKSIYLKLLKLDSACAPAHYHLPDSAIFYMSLGALLGVRTC